MKKVWKNQLQIIWRKWFTFTGIFILLCLSSFLTSGALATYRNINQVISSLKQSNQYQTQIKLFSNFSSYGLKTITDYFFQQPFKDDDLKIRYQIERNQKITVDYHADEIAAWNYNFQAWLIQKLLNSTFDQYQVAVDYNVTKITGFINQQTYQINAFNGFNDADWVKPQPSLVNYQRLNLKQQNLVIISQGRAAKTNDEVVVNVNSENQFDANLAVGKLIIIDGKTYHIVGKGYNYASYFHDDEYETKQSNTINLWFTNSELERFWRATEQQVSTLVNRRAFYYVNAPPPAIKELRRQLINYYVSVTRYSVVDTRTLQTDDFHYQLALLEIMLFLIIGILVFTITLLMTTIFIKKEINRQKQSLGLLIALGSRPFLLALILSLTFFTLLFLPIVIGFISSFGLQFYLSKLIGQIIFYPFALINWSWLAFIIVLVAFPGLLISVTVTFIFMLLKQKPLTLLHYYPNIKSHRFHEESKRLKHWKLINTRLTFAFIRGNQQKIIGTLTIYFLNMLLVLFLFLLINIYNTSLNASQRQYTNYGNREFTSENTTISTVFNCMNQHNSYQFDVNTDYHWISYDDFKAAIVKQTTIYHEITLNDFFEHHNLKNCYFTPETVAQVVPTLADFQNYDQNLYQTLLQANNYWNIYHTYPYITFGFKLYDTDKSMLLTRLSLYFDPNLASTPTRVALSAFNNQSFNQWIYLATENNEAAIDQLTTKNENYVNAIISAQLATRYHLKLNDITFLDSSIDFARNSLLTIPIRIVGINKDNYVNNQAIVDQTTFFSYLFNHYHQTYPTATIIMPDASNLSNMMLVRDQLPEVNRNLSFISLDNNYAPDSNYRYNFIPSSTNYLNQTYPQIKNDQLINSLMNGFIVLLTNILVIGFIVLLILFYLMFVENKKAMLMLKFLGYHNLQIISLIIVPYLIGLVILSLAVIAICYFMIQLVLSWLFINTEILLFFSFSPIIIFSFALIVILFILSSFIIGYWHIKKIKLRSLNEEP